MELCAPSEECIGFDWGMPLQEDSIYLNPPDAGDAQSPGQILAEPNDL